MSKAFEQGLGMEVGPLGYLLALAAGALSTLAPGVLPLIPILAGGALLAHRRGPLTMAAGLALSYAGIGLTLATAGAIAGLGHEQLRAIGAAMSPTRVARDSGVSAPRDAAPRPFRNPAGWR